MLFSRFIAELPDNLAMIFYHVADELTVKTSAAHRQQAIALLASLGSYLPAGRYPKLKA